MTHCSNAKSQPQWKVWLPQFSKILDKSFSEKRDDFIEKQNIISEIQYSFRSNKSTSMALLELIEEITSPVNNKKCTIDL